MIYSEPAPEVAARPAPLTAATLRAVGLRAAHDRPAADAALRLRASGRRCSTPGTRADGTVALGPVEPLVERDDDAVAIFGPGEDILLEFAAPEAPLPAGWTRRVVLDAKGWCKDMDLYTQDGETVAPLPGVDSAERRALHGAFNTRYEGGR